MANFAYCKWVDDAIKQIKKIDNYVFVYKANRKGCYGTFLDIGLGDFLPGFQHKQI